MVKHRSNPFWHEPTRLPAPPTSPVGEPMTTFLGREVEQEDVLGYLQRPDVCLPTLIGPGARLYTG